MKYWVVDKYVDENLIKRYRFDTQREAINFVSGEYTYYDNKYVKTGHFNCATTTNKPIAETFDDDNDYYTDPFEDDLVEAYIDSWDAVFDWIIRER